MALIKFTEILNSHERIYVYGTNEVPQLIARYMKEKYGRKVNGFVFQKWQSGKEMETHYGESGAFTHPVFGDEIPIYSLTTVVEPGVQINLLILVDGSNPEYNRNLDELEDYMDGGHVHLYIRKELADMEDYFRNSFQIGEKS